jgi:glucan phosphoethanolaminetransferase (alkaline phosphatase superfamily)
MDPEPPTTFDYATPVTERRFSFTRAILNMFLTSMQFVAFVILAAMLAFAIFVLHSMLGGNSTTGRRSPESFATQFGMLLASLVAVFVWGALILVIQRLKPGWYTTPAKRWPAESQ